MLTTLALLAALAAPVPDPGAAAGLVVDALRRENPSIVPTAGNYETGALGDVIETYDGITVLSSRVAGVQQTDHSTVLLAEIDATAVTSGTRRAVTLPRWWSIELQPEGGAWRVIFAGTLERWLAVQLALASPEQLSAALERPDVDPERLLVPLARAARDAGACNTVLWVLETSRRRGLRKSELAALRSLSYLEVAGQRAAEGVRIAQQSIELAEGTRDPEAIVETRFSLAYALWFSDRLDEAVETFAAAGALAGLVDDPRQAIRALHMAGSIELRRERLADALIHAEGEEMLAARYRLPRLRMAGAALLGAIHSRLGNVDIARRQDEIALQASREMHDRRLEAMALFNLGSAALDELEYARARELLHQSLTIGEGHLQPSELLAVQQTYAHLQLQEHDLDGAEETVGEVLRTAAELDERTVLSAIHLLRAEIRLLQGRAAEALADARQARRFMESGDRGKKMTYTMRLATPSLTMEGRALRAGGQNEAAEAVWRAAIDVAEAELADRATGDAGTVTFHEIRLRPYGELLDLLVEQGCIREALDVAERMRARTLRDALRHGRIDLSAGLDDASRTQERELERRIAAVNRALLDATERSDVERLTGERAEARLALRRFQTALYVSRRDLRARRPATLDEVAGWEPDVAPDELVLEMVVTPASTFVFALRQKNGRLNVAVSRLAIERDALERRVNAFVASVENRDFSYRREASALHDLLLGPVAAEAASVARLRIVPDGVLWRLPFHVLIDGGGRHLAERMPVSYAPALAVPPRERRGAASRELFALGDPSVRNETLTAARSRFRAPALGALPDAAKEARAIGRLYEDAEVRVGREANESAFKNEAGPYRVLHLAAHSIVDDSAPMYSSIVLASSGQDPLEDGLLEAREIADLKLHADLAVLSGCETARGKVTRGDGMIGLSWAFLAAGVPTTVVSQWKVGSESTAPLMIAFHHHLRGGANAAAALRAAMMELRGHARFRHPFYWAPFVVVENGTGAAD